MNFCFASRIFRIALCAIDVSLALGGNAWATDSNIGETASTSDEILFCSGLSAPYVDASNNPCLAVELRTKADTLASPVMIYEYVRNNSKFALYQGARSGSINSFLSSSGNDVDLAATLIAMLRSQGTPARYVVGTVHLPAAQVMNWLQVENADLAYGLLRDQGIQKVVLAADKSTIDFEHVWVEALVPYTEYRGVGTKLVDCNTTPSSCNWVPLDPSFKQHRQTNSGLDPFSSLSFDYAKYYEAIYNTNNGGDTSRLNKNPLEIYQEQVLAWLQTKPGKTLEDIPDFTGILAEEDGLLPASLPFTTVGTLRRYNSAADHDAEVPATESKRWMKTVTAQAKFSNLILGDATVSLVDAATKRFTFTFSNNSSNTAEIFQLGGIQVGTAMSTGTVIVNGQTLTLGTPFSLVVSMDGAPAPDTGGTDETITATYNAMVGGYYLIATGGESSNWSQVHRAAQQLLAASRQYKIVFNPADPGTNGQACDFATHLNCTPYVDANNSSAWDASDPRLVDSSAALDALTGGLLYVAGTQYYASLNDDIAQLDRLNKTKTPISGFLGVVSSTPDVEYIDGTAFSVLPGGLLIDMKGIHLAGSWRIDQAESFSNDQFDLISHVSSSLEHETWQKLTGYDAISTVRGIQFARNAGAIVVYPIRSTSTDTVVNMYPSFGYATTAPSSFTRNVRTIFGQDYVSWSYNGTGTSSFYAMRPDVSGLPSGDPLMTVWSITSANGIDGSLSNYLSTYNGLLSDQAQAEQIVTNIPLSLTDTVDFPSADVISASLTNSPGFVLSATPFSRASSTQYTFYVNETSALPDGTYNINLNAVLSNKDGGLILNGNVSPYNPGAIQIISPAGFSVNSPSFSLSNWTFNLKRTTADDGTYSLTFVVYVSQGGYVSYTVNVQVLSGRIVLGTINNVGYSYTVHNNSDLTCNGTTFTNQTPTELLGDLQGCFNAYVAANSDYFNFFTPAASLVFRGYPTATNDAQLTTQIACIRNTLDQQNLSQVWGEYVVPSLLSVGPNFRFGVYIFKSHDATSSSGNVTGETFAIVNDQTTSPFDGSLGTTCP